MYFSLKNISILSLVYALSGCSINTNTDDIEGSGNIISEQRKIKPFHAILIKGSTNIKMTQSPDISLYISADDNILPLIKAHVDQGTLVIETTQDYSSNETVKINLVTPTLDMITIDGASHIGLNKLHTKKLTIHVNGAGQVHATGKADYLDIRVKGAANVDAQKLISNHVNARIEGAGKIHVHPTQAIKASVEGVGSIIYEGNPSTIASSISGVGSIKKA